MSAASASAERRAPMCSSTSGGFHTAIRRRAPRRPVGRDVRELLQPGQPLGQLDRVGDRRAGHEEARVGRHPPQPPQDVADVRPEHPAVDVRLVDDHDVEAVQELRPRAVVGEDPDVQHVRVRQDDVRPLADRRALLARRVAVVDRRADLLVQAERVQRARLVLRERLRRVEVERARRRLLEQVRERRQVEAHGFPGSGAGGDDEVALHRRVDRLDLVRVQRLDAQRSRAPRRAWGAAAGCRRARAGARARWPRGPGARPPALPRAARARARAPGRAGESAGGGESARGIALPS